MQENYVISADIGGTHIRAALVDRAGTVVLKLKEHTGSDPLAVLNRLIESLYRLHPDNIVGVGLAVAALVDRVKGFVLRAPNIQKLNGVNLKTEIAATHNISAVVENDANAAAFGEKCFGAGRDFNNFVILTLGTGIGGGIVINNQLLPVAAEIGHMTISADGRVCSCGNTGCLESFASATAIVNASISEIEKGSDSILKRLYNGNFYKITAEDIYKAALEGDSLSRTVLREAGKNLGVGIANITNMLSPDAVILAGGLVGAWNIFVDAAIKEASRRAMKELFCKVAIVPASLGDNAGIAGAAALAFRAME